MRHYVTIVSGLPRSGTSLVMQMLAAGGMPLLVDDARPPDADNPRGYFEYGPAKRLAAGADWIAIAEGRAVKVIAPLLRHLPASHAYRVLLVTRRVDEVIASQERMLTRRGAAGVDGLAPERLAEILAAQLAEARRWIEGRGLEIAHADLLRDPGAVAAAIDAALDGGLDRAAMAEAVAPALHRQRR